MGICEISALNCKKHSGPCGGRDCSGGCKCFPEKGARVSPVLYSSHFSEVLLPVILRVIQCIWLMHI
uniref:Uncharacterized protein n=1 Tax=Poecilia latipinna TaxID=48699 RepID=A0A3B3VTH3_9TELE